MYKFSLYNTFSSFHSLSLIHRCSRRAKLCTAKKTMGRRRKTLVRFQAVCSARSSQKKTHNFSPTYCFHVLCFMNIALFVILLLRSGIKKNSNPWKCGRLIPPAAGPPHLEALSFQWRLTAANNPLPGSSTFTGDDPMILIKSGRLMASEHGPVHSATPPTQLTALSSNPREFYSHIF